MNTRSTFAGGGELDALLQTTTTWLAVLAVLAGLAFWWRQRRRGAPSGFASRLQRVATLRLGPRAVHLVLVDGQRVLVSDNGIAVLDVAAASHNVELAPTESAGDASWATRQRPFGDDER